MRNVKRRWPRRLLIGFVIILAALLLAIWLLMGSSITSLASIRRPQADKDFFVMDYQADYALDKLLEDGIASDTELIQFLVRNLLMGLPVTIDVPEIGCTTFVAKTPAGGHLFGRNFDLTESPGMLLYTRPKTGYASMSMVNLSFLGFSPTDLPTNLLNSFKALAAPYVPMDGVNEKGLAIGVLMLQTGNTKQDTGKKPITTTVAIRMILDRAATVDEAVELLRGYDLQASAGGDHHFHLADAQGNSVVVSYENNEMVVTQSKAAANFRLVPGAHDPRGIGHDRYDGAIKRLAETDGSLSVQEAMDLLEKVHSIPEMWPDKETQTQWSAVYDLQKNQSLLLSIARDFEQLETYHLNTQ